MEQAPKISETVYVVMCWIVGTPTQVSIRREVADISDMLKKPVKPHGLRVMVSGSMREGFGRFASDIDFMVWLTDHHVLWDLNHIAKYNIKRCTLLLMECFETPPGYALLQLLPSTNNVVIQSCAGDTVIVSCEEKNDRIYISSSKYRKMAASLVKENPVQHGPCMSGRDFYTKYEFAYCFACRLWPSIASAFTLRCRSQAWPPNPVLSDIANSGCHVVPIGFKESPEEDLEWRISFSIAEQKLVYCMNHTQFMCYGLLKLFLKEVLTVEDKTGQSLLCSYFMKTVLFWVIQNNKEVSWDPPNLLSGFWVCFKFLISCVHRECLPNFFMPVNNIFISKIYGHSRHVLLEKLFENYNLGIACLLHCHSIRDYLTLAICNRRYVLSTAESNIISELCLDCELFHEISFNDSPWTMCFNARLCFNPLYSAVKYLLMSNLNPRQQVALRKFISTILRDVVYYLYNTSNNVCNKSRLRTSYACLKFLKTSTDTGFSSDRIYLALFLYSMGKTVEAIRYLKMIKSIVAQRCIIFVHEYDAEEENYLEGLSLSQKIRWVVTKPILLDNDNMIKELELECKLIKNIDGIYVPPYVMTLMLLILCYRGNPHKQKETLYELYNLLHYEEGLQNPRFFLHISWQILGICQEICGDHQGAFLSYRNSLQEIPFQNIREATYYRMLGVLYRILFL